MQELPADPAPTDPPPFEEQRERRADQERLCARVGAVVHACRVGARREESRHEHRGPGRQRRGDPEKHWARAARQAQQQQERRRPHEVELLLDRQRPHMLEWRRRRELREVRLAGGDEPPIGDIADRGERVAAQPLQHVGGRPAGGEHRDRSEHEEQRR